MSVRLPSSVRRLILADAVGSIGFGITLPLTLIYLHRARHIPLATTGLLLAVSGVVALAALPAAGALADRFGPARVLPVIALTLALGDCGLAWAHSPATAIGPLILAGGSGGALFSVFGALLGDLAPDPELQQRAFAVNFTALNAAVGLGSLVTSAVVSLAHPGTFQALYLSAAGCETLFALLLAGLATASPAHVREASDDPAGYRQLLRLPGMRLLAVIGLLLALCGYAAVDSGLPGYSNVVAHVSPRVVALSVTVNTAVIVVVQLWVLRLLRGRRPARALAGVGLVWAACWLLLGSSALPGSRAVRAGMVLGFAGVFGVGETLMQPTLTPLVNRLAGERMRGRANALNGGMFSLGFVVSPALCGGLIGAHLGGVWIGLLVALALGTSVASLRLDGQLGGEVGAAVGGGPTLGEGHDPNGRGAGAPVEGAAAGLAAVLSVGGATRSPADAQSPPG